MKLAVFAVVCALLLLGANAGTLTSEDDIMEESPLVRSKRAACWAGEAGCAAYCYTRGYKRGGCCGKQYTNCHNTCYCNGSGYEYRCYRCDI